MLYCFIYNSKIIKQAPEAVAIFFAEEKCKFAHNRGKLPTRRTKPKQPPDVVALCADDYRAGEEEAATDKPRPCCVPSMAVALSVSMITTPKNEVEAMGLPASSVALPWLSVTKLWSSVCLLHHRDDVTDPKNEVEAAARCRSSLCR